MSKFFTAKFPDGSERFASSFANLSAQAFFDQTQLLEGYVNAPSGISPDFGENEHLIDPSLFEQFFELVWKADWLVEKQNGLFHPWARLAAGMLENITFQPRTLIDRNGEELLRIRYMRPDE